MAKFVQTRYHPHSCCFIARVVTHLGGWHHPPDTTTKHNNYLFACQRRSYSNEELRSSAAVLSPDPTFSCVGGARDYSAAKLMRMSLHQKCNFFYYNAHPCANKFLRFTVLFVSVRFDCENQERNSLCLSS